MMEVICCGGLNEENKGAPLSGVAGGHSHSRYNLGLICLDWRHTLTREENDGLIAQVKT